MSGHGWHFCHRDYRSCGGDAIAFLEGNTLYMLIPSAVKKFVREERQGTTLSHSTDKPKARKHKADWKAVLADVQEAVEEFCMKKNFEGTKHVQVWRGA
jgi:hypothetical protein